MHSKFGKRPAIVQFLSCIQETLLLLRKLIFKFELQLHVFDLGYDVEIKLDSRATAAAARAALQISARASSLNFSRYEICIF